MRVYIVWMKGKKVTFKNPSGREFRVYLTSSPFSWDIRETDSLTRLFNFQHVLLTWLFRGLASRKIHLSNTCLILHQLNTKPNTIKTHKIQGTKLKQIQHFLSWKKVNIKHSCKSQLYTNKSPIILSAAENKFDTGDLFTNGENLQGKTPLGDFKVTTSKNVLLSNISGYKYKESYQTLWPIPKYQATVKPLP